MTITILKQELTWWLISEHSQGVETNRNIHHAAGSTHTESVVIHSVCRPLVQLPASGSLVEEGNCFVFRCSLVFQIRNLCRFRQSNWYCLTCIVDNERDVAYVFCFKIYIGIVLPGKHNVHLNDIGSWRTCIHWHQLFKIPTSFILLL
jgi:hypothetical protein